MMPRSVAFQAAMPPFLGAHFLVLLCYKLPAICGAGTRACRVETHLDPPSCADRPRRRHECRRGSPRGCAPIASLPLCVAPPPSLRAPPPPPPCPARPSRRQGCRRGSLRGCATIASLRLCVAPTPSLGAPCL